MKAILGIARVQVQRKAIEALNFFEIDSFRKLVGIRVKLELIELQNRPRASRATDGAGPVCSQGSRSGIAREGIDFAPLYGRTFLGDLGGRTDHGRSL